MVTIIRLFFTFIKANYLCTNINIININRYLQVASEKLRIRSLAARSGLHTIHFRYHFANCEEQVPLAGNGKFLLQLVLSNEQQNSVIYTDIQVT